MASKFTDFLMSFGDDPTQIQAFEKDPRAVMANAGLTQAEQDMIMNRDVQGIRNHLHADPILRQALGVADTQPLPAQLPMLIFMVPKPGP
jgi:hypothetical protein